MMATLRRFIIALALSGILAGMISVSPGKAHAAAVRLVTIGTLTVTPNPVTVGSTAIVRGSGFTPNSTVVVFWRRPDNTRNAIRIGASMTGMFAFTLGFAPVHGIGTERIAATDEATGFRTATTIIDVLARGTGMSMLSASVNPVADGGVTLIVGRRFTPGALVIVQWHRPDGTMGVVRVIAGMGGEFAFQLFAEPSHGCGVRTFTALDTATLLAAPPFSLGELC